MRAVDRLTRSEGFTALFAVATLVVGPVLLLGWLGTPLLLLSMSDPARSIPYFLLTAAGTAGVVGWIRAHWQIGPSPRGNVETTMICLSLGVAAALVPIGFAAFAAIPRGHVGANVWAATILAAAHAIVAIAAVGWMQRLAWHYADRTGRRFDTLPVIFLLVALGLAAAAIVVATNDASALSSARLAR
jgi:hypothetical protein